MGNINQYMLLHVAALCCTEAYNKRQEVEVGADVETDKAPNPYHLGVGLFAGFVLAGCCLCLMRELNAPGESQRSGPSQNKNTIAAEMTHQSIPL